MAGRGNRGGRGGGGGGQRSREEQISRALSKLLRHQAEKEGLKLRPGGYVNLQEVLQNRLLRSLKITMPEIQAIVAENEKQRFKLIPITEAPLQEDAEAASSSGSSNPPDLDQNDPSHWLIRANQGHSIKVDEDGLMEPITLESELPTTVVHGTTSKAWPLIVSSGGLKKMTRNHVHFASGLPAGFRSLAEASNSSDEVVKAEPVISGMRNSSSILIFIDIKKALDSGLKFWKSANGVILSEGNDRGLIPVEFFRKVEDRRSGKILMEDGHLKT